MGGLDFGAVLDLVNGIMGATKPKQEGQEGNQIDMQKIGLVVLSFAGRQGLSWFLKNRRTKKEAKLMARGIKPEAARPKKSGKFVPGLLVGTGLGVAGYLLVMKPEDRENLFKNIDKVINEATGLISEFQGKPYSANYEK